MCWVRKGREVGMVKGLYETKVQKGEGPCVETRKEKDEPPVHRFVFVARTSDIYSTGSRHPRKPR